MEVIRVSHGARLSESSFVVSHRFLIHIFMSGSTLDTASDAPHRTAADEMLAKLVLVCDDLGR